MLIPWFAVSLVFWAAPAIVSGDLGSITWKSAIALFVRPFFHLWYIPALFIGVLIFWVCVRIRHGYWVIGALSIVGFIAFQTPIAEMIEPVEVVDYRYFGFFIWLAAGFLVRNANLRLPSARYSFLILLVGIALYVTDFYMSGDEWLLPVSLLVLNGGLFGCYPSILRWLDARSPSAWYPWESVGRESLWVYLLHPAITYPFILVTVGNPWQPLLGLALTVAIYAISVLLILLLSRSPRVVRVGNVD